MRWKLARFFQGRNGADQLSKFLLIPVLLLVIAANIVNIFSPTVSAILWLPAVALLVWDYFRILSRNIYKRQRENMKYLELKQKIKSFFRRRREHFRYRKDYKFFKCPRCATVIRAPRGKGKIRITCRKCGEAFIRKT